MEGWDASDVSDGWDEEEEREFMTLQFSVDMEQLRRRSKAVERSMEKALARGPKSKFAARIPMYESELQNLSERRAHGRVHNRTRRKRMAALLEKRRLRKAEREKKRAAFRAARLSCKRILRANMAKIKAKLWRPGGPLEMAYRLTLAGFGDVAVVAHASHIEDGPSTSDAPPPKHVYTVTWVSTGEFVQVSDTRVSSEALAAAIRDYWDSLIVV